MINPSKYVQRECTKEEYNKFVLEHHEHITRESVQFSDSVSIFTRDTDTELVIALATYPNEDHRKARYYTVTYLEMEGITHG